METFVFIIIAGISAYLLLKLCLYIYRPFFLSKTLAGIEQEYNKLIAAVDKEIAEDLERLEKVQSGEGGGSEDLITENIKDVKTEKAHQEQVHEKFLRLKERFNRDYGKLSESIAAYQRYLDLKLEQSYNARYFVNAVISGTVSHDEFESSARKMGIALEECERKFDVLLA